MVRCSVVKNSLVLSLLFAACLCQAANIDTFAKVNLVQGMEASLDIGSRGISSQENPNDPSRIQLSGPANYNVDVRLATLEPGAQWSDQASSPGIKMDSRYDFPGEMNLDLLFDGLSSGNNSTDQPVRYIITLTYE